MARIEVPIIVQNSSTGLPVNGASVAISSRVTGAPVTWYTTETGSTSSTSAIITDANGRVNAWVPRGAYNFTITGTGITTYVEPWDAVPASDGSIDGLWVGDGTLTTAKLAASLQTAIFDAGDLKLTGKATAPSGWLICDGSAVSRTTYAALFSAISTRFGAGDGSTTFNLPDLRGRVPVGVDASAGRVAAATAVGVAGGAETITLSAAQSGVAPHGHGVTDPTHSHVVQASASFLVGSGAGYGLAGTAQNSGSTVGSTQAASTGISVQSHAGAAASSSHANVQPYQVVNYIIKT